MICMKKNDRDGIETTIEIYREEKRERERERTGDVSRI